LPKTCIVLGRIAVCIKKKESYVNIVPPHNHELTPIHVTARITTEKLEEKSYPAAL